MNPTSDMDTRPQGNLILSARRQSGWYGTHAPTPPAARARSSSPRDRQPLPFPGHEHLRRLRAQLRTNIPGDATHAAAVSTLLGALVDFEFARPPVIPTRSLDDDPVHTADGLDELDVLAK